MNKNKLHTIFNSSAFMEKGMQELMVDLNEGWKIVNIHNNTDGRLTIYLLSKEQGI